MTDILELAAKVEALDGPDREVMLSAYVACYSNGGTNWASDACHSARYEFLVSNEAWLEAAIMLVPEGWRVRNFGDWEDRWLITLMNEDTCETVGARTGRGQRALALVAAALRARRRPMNSKEIPEYLTDLTDTLDLWAQKVLVWFAGSATAEDITKLKEFLSDMPTITPVDKFYVEGSAVFHRTEDGNLFMGEMHDGVIAQAFADAMNGESRHIAAQDVRIEALETVNQLFMSENAPLTNAALRSDNAKMKGRIEALEGALRDIMNPIAAMQRKAEAEGCRLSGMAYSIANDPNHLQQIAKAALGGEQHGG